MSVPLKGPLELAAQLRRQWADVPRRLRQLLSEPGAWPLELPIPWPGSRAMEADLDAVRRHVQAWRGVAAGEVRWAERRYRATGEAVTLPRAWHLRTPGEWVTAMGDADIARQYALLGRLAALPEVQARPAWLAVLIRQSPLLTADEHELARAVAVAAQLSPGCAGGLPLRALPHVGVDSKFWERQRVLLTALLEALHPGQVAPSGLEVFLHADPSGAHWLDVIDLDGGLLPWPQLRVRSQDLTAQGPPGEGVVLIENHQCLHHLPARGTLRGTVAILGAGLDLAWLAAPWLRARRVAYWGDIDTWGLTMLARARQALPQLQALMMDEATWRRYRLQAGTEPQPNPEPPAGLQAAEQALFARLKADPEHGRLEQERLPVAPAREAIARWAAGADATGGSAPALGPAQG